MQSKEFENLFICIALAKSEGNQIWFMEQIEPETARVLTGIAEEFFHKVGEHVPSNKLTPVAECLWGHHTGHKHAFFVEDYWPYRMARLMADAAGPPRHISLIKEIGRITHKECVHGCC